MRYKTCGNAQLKVIQSNKQNTSQIFILYNYVYKESVVKCIT